MTAARGGGLFGVIGMKDAVLGSRAICLEFSFWSLLRFKGGGFGGSENDMDGKGFKQKANGQGFKQRATSGGSAC